MPHKIPLLGQPRRHGTASIVGNGMDSLMSGLPLLVLQMQVLGNESGAQSLDLCGPGFNGWPGKRLPESPQKKNSPFFRIHRNGFKGWLARFDHLHTPGDGAAPSQRPRPKISTLPSVSAQISSAVVCDEFPRWRIIKLLRNPSVRVFLGELFRTGNRALHAFGAGVKPVSRRASPQRAAVPVTSFPAGQIFL